MGPRERRRARGAVAIAALLAGGLAAAPLPPARPVNGAAEAPLPPPRPPEQGPPPPVALAPPMPPGPLRPAPAPASPEAPAATADEERVCAALLASGKVVARASEPVGGPGGCGMAAPVSLSAILLAPARRIGLAPPVEVACGIAAAFADWVRDDLVPLFDRAELPLTGLVGTSGYSCRGRNHLAGAKLSEHGLGDAVDIGGFATGRAGVIGLADSRAALLAAIRHSACARFSTVLGPGSDGFHEGHLHVDLIRRRNGVTLCQWDLPGGDTAPNHRVALPRSDTGRRGPL